VKAEVPESKKQDEPPKQWNFIIKKATMICKNKNKFDDVY